MENQEVIEELILKTASGNIESFEDLYLKVNKIVYSYVFAILKNHERAQDVMQDTFIKINESASKYIPQGKPLAWILKISKNFALMSIRKNNKEQIIDIEENEYLLNKTAELDVDEKLVLNAALEVLENEEREIVFLYLVSGMKHKEIAKVLDKPLGT